MSLPGAPVAAPGFVSSNVADLCAKFEESFPRSGDPRCRSLKRTSREPEGPERTRDVELERRIVADALADYAETPISTVSARAAQLLCAEPGEIIMRCDGERLSGNETHGESGLCDGGTIDVFRSVAGGGKLVIDAPGLSPTVIETNHDDRTPAQIAHQKELELRVTLGLSLTDEQARELKSIKMLGPQPIRMLPSELTTHFHPAIGIISARNHRKEPIGLGLASIQGLEPETFLGAFTGVSGLQRDFYKSLPAEGRVIYNNYAAPYDRGILDEAELIDSAPPSPRRRWRRVPPSRSTPARPRACTSS